jgi:hypothetical protein
VVTMKLQKVWTFRIIGGARFSLAFPGNPPCEHNQGTTIWKMVGTADHMCQVLVSMEELVCTGSVEVLTETETPEMEALRAKRMTPDATQ